MADQIKSAFAKMQPSATAQSKVEQDRKAAQAIKMQRQAPKVIQLWLKLNADASHENFGYAYYDRENARVIIGLNSAHWLTLASLTNAEPPRLLSFLFASQLTEFLDARLSDRLFQALRDELCSRVNLDPKKRHKRLSYFANRLTTLFTSSLAASLPASDSNSQSETLVATFELKNRISR